MNALTLPALTAAIASHDLQVLIRLHPDAREFRLFRQIDGGDLELIAQGAADGSLLPSIPVLDPALPP
ncbi:MAG: hypothetical protein U1G07_27280 [Verrucomicrobiota bacterium]